jgi:hypothetical protein
MDVSLDPAMSRSRVMSVPGAIMLYEFFTRTCDLRQTASRQSDVSRIRVSTHGGVPTASLSKPLPR